MNLLPIVITKIPSKDPILFAITSKISPLLVVVNVCCKNFDAGRNSITIDTKSLTRGIYFCIMDVDGTIVTKKLLKN